MPRLGVPRALFFDWHGTLADTFVAMYRAVEEMLPELGALGLEARLLAPGAARLPEHEALVAHVRAQRNLPAEVKRARRISRTEIFEILFGADADAKHAAHEAFDRCYARHVGAVHPFEPGVRAMLGRLRAAGLRTGLLTNRRRALFGGELRRVDGSGWEDLFDVLVCGDDVPRRKPAPDMVLRALEELGLRAGPEVWFIGDSTTDVIAARQAGVRAIFYNGAKWDPRQLVRIFPPEHPPDAITGDFSALETLALPPKR
ncbi:MAG TPA: HAD-IA family hydrolase [Burkholderiales bacterium]|nr:HAD-IA family hydrolase [Burkholderiales bacterium]